jgi:hypothetical protein
VGQESPIGRGALELIGRNEEVRIGLVPCAHGGSRLDQWREGSEFYTTAVQKAHAVSLREFGYRYGREYLKVAAREGIELIAGQPA